MITIPVHVCGDKWVNRLEVQTLLDRSLENEHIIFDLLSEGPSLRQIGLIELVKDRDPNLISLINAPNRAENLPYQNLTPGPSHFFTLAKSYWTQLQSPLACAKRFGLFVGRRTISRCYILWQCHTLFRNECLFSLMHTIMRDPWLESDSDNLEKWQDFMTAEEFEMFLDWWTKHDLQSLTGHTVSDQYKSGHNTNLDLIYHSNKFYIEIVPESYTLGDTFFPTEKTVRPLVTGKPLIVYGPRHFLARLRDLGFHTWGDCWDESYDAYEGPERWQAMKHTLDYVRSMEPDTFLRMTRSLHDRHALNRNLVKKLGRIHDN